MKPQTPTCELLARQETDYRQWLFVAPPRDPWLESSGGRVWSADCRVVQAWQEAGATAHTSLSSPTFSVAGAVLFWPKSHALGEWWMHALDSALPQGTPIQVVGENQGGVRRVPKLLDALDYAWRKVDSARRCSLFAFTSAGMPQPQNSGWMTFPARELTLASHPGVFGHGKLDDGTRLLLECLPTVLPTQAETHRALDVGSGDGIVAAWLASRGFGVTATDVNAFAVEATRRTLSANALEGEALLSDVFSQVEGSFDVIVSNPPFHHERAIDYGPAARLIHEAPGYLTAGGALILVANAFLPYPAFLQSAFGSFEILADNGRYRVYQAFKNPRSR